MYGIQTVFVAVDLHVVTPFFRSPALLLSFLSLVRNIVYFNTFTAKSGVYTLDRLTFLLCCRTNGEGIDKNHETSRK